MRKFTIPLAALVAILGLPATASAGEVYAGAYVHGVGTPFTFDTEEDGLDFQLGYRFDPIDALAGIEPYVIGSLNSAGDTSFAGVGVSRRFDLGTVYLRPGVGIVVHDGPDLRFGSDGGRTDLGSRVLLEPEIALGTQVSERVSIEASWVHVSHARIFNSGQNPGIDMMGLRLNLRL